jgi:molecular chaperone GrpE
MATQPNPQQNDDLQEISTSKDKPQIPISMEKLTAELEENKEKYLRTLAEFQNYQRRNEEEKKQLRKYGEADLLKELLRIMDNLEKAFENLTPTQAKDDILAGILHTKRDFEMILKNHGVMPMETSERQFNHSHHEAVMSAPGQKNLILKELEKGYMLMDKVLRPAKVIVGNGEDAATLNRQKELQEELAKVAGDEVKDLEETSRADKVS